MDGSSGCEPVIRPVRLLFPARDTSAPDSCLESVRRLFRLVNIRSGNLGRGACDDATDDDYRTPTGVVPVPVRVRNVTTAVV